MAAFEDFIPVQRISRSVSISADGSRVAYVSDASGQFNVWIRPTDGGLASQVTFYADHSVREVSWVPDGSAIAFTADKYGNELTQVYLVSINDNAPVQLSRENSQHQLARKAPCVGAGRFLLCSGNDRGKASPDLVTYDLSTGSRSRFTGPANASAFATAVSPSGKYLLAGAISSNTRCECYLAPRDQPGALLEAVTADLPGYYYYPGPWADDEKSFYLLTTDADGDHVCLARFYLRDRSLTIIDAPDWNVEDVVASGDGRTVVWTVNYGGCSVLKAQRDGREVEITSVPDAVIKAMSLSADGSMLASVVDNAVRPAEVVLTYLGVGGGVRYLTDTRPLALRATRPLPPKLVHYPAIDKSRIPAFLYRPTTPTPHPVLLWVHGGPESQARPAYDPLRQCLIGSGIAVLTPNIRGSSGYGHAWQTSIYRDWGGIDLEDLAAAHAWLANQSWVETGRIAIFGMSYGGYAALSCVTRLPHLWAAAVSVSGPSNLNTLARSLPPNWAGTVAAMFGDPNDPVDAVQLSKRSPINYASQICTPLLVIQGATDPRVPQAESDQIVTAARANGADVQYEIFKDEGHGFTDRENTIKANTIIVGFLAKHLCVNPAKK